MHKENIFKNRKRDKFLPIMTKIFTIARWFGIPTYGGRIAFIWSLVLLVMLITIEIGAIWKLVRLLAGYAVNLSGGRNLTARLSGSIFYGNALLSLILSWRTVKIWQSLSLYWLQSEVHGLHFAPDVTIRRRVTFVSIFVAVCAIVEHMLSMMSATGFNCPPEEYFKRYILSSHGFLLQEYEYTLWLAIPIFVLSKSATILWNFQDLIIILVSMGLASRYHRMNYFVKLVVRYEKSDKNVKKGIIILKTFVAPPAPTTIWKPDLYFYIVFGGKWRVAKIDFFYNVNIWRKIRRAYVKQSALVRRVDRELGPLVLLSNLNNLYFICLQLLLGTRELDGTLINHIYYFYSLGWLLFRACSVVLAAADVNLHSKRALPYLYSCPSTYDNIEIKRLKNQLGHDEVILSGMGFFSLDRQKLLEVAAAIVKYELILIQFDK